MNFSGLLRKVKSIKYDIFPLYTKKDVLRLTNSTGGKGFFSVMNGILGGIHEFDKGHLAGIEFRFTDGLYANEKGDNWPLYYFEFNNLPQVKEINSKIKSINEIPFSLHLLTRKAERQENFRLIQKYLKINPDILAEADAICSGFENKYTIGIHFRGTDKVAEAEPVSYEQILQFIRRETEIIGHLEFQIFVATDELSFIHFMEQQYGKRVKYLDYAERSADDKPVHFQKTQKRPYELGKEALIDALVLSRTQLLIRTSSNLSLSSTFFNPELRVVLVNQRFGSSVE